MFTGFFVFTGTIKFILLNISSYYLIYALCSVWETKTVIFSFFMKHDMFNILAKT